MVLDKVPLLGNVYVKGEISNFTNHYKTGHFYLTLKDENGLIRAVMFKSSASKLMFEPEDGMKVIVLTRGYLQGTLLTSHRSKPCRKAAVELAEVSSIHSTEEVANHHGGKGWTIRSCVKSKVNDCAGKQLLYGD